MTFLDWEVSFVLEELQCICNSLPVTYPIYIKADFFYNLIRLDIPNSLANEYNSRMLIPIMQAQRLKELEQLLKAKEGLKRLCNPETPFKNIGCGAFAPHTHVYVDNLK